MHHYCYDSFSPFTFRKIYDINHHFLFHLVPSTAMVWMWWTKTMCPSATESQFSGNPVCCPVFTLNHTNSNNNDYNYKSSHYVTVSFYLLVHMSYIHSFFSFIFAKTVPSWKEDLCYFLQVSEPNWEPWKMDSNTLFRCFKTTNKISRTFMLKKYACFFWSYQCLLNMDAKN